MLIFRITKKEDIFLSLSMFSPNNFKDVLNLDLGEIENRISALCTPHKINTEDCARELRSFASTFEKLRNLRKGAAETAEDEHGDETDDDVNEVVEVDENEKLEKKRTIMMP